MPAAGALGAKHRLSPVTATPSRADELMVEYIGDDEGAALHSCTFGCVTVRQPTFGQAVDKLHLCTGPAKSYEGGLVGR